eukprot:COSAG02_NODE_4020_length_5892_cov_7.078716_6_plen_147_part_00
MYYTNNELGRLEAKMTNLKKGETCATQMRLHNVIKAVGCRDIYTDVDIVCCHPNLLVQLFESEGLDTTYLKMYVSNRQQLVEQMGVTKRAVKEMVFGLMYNSGHFNRLAERLVWLLGFDPTLSTILRMMLRSVRLKRSTTDCDVDR